MTRSLAFFAAIVVALTFSFAADELPKNDGDESFEIEPPLLIPNRELETLAGPNASPTPAPVLDPIRLEKDLERARKSAAGAERLFKIGALAKVEAEQRALRVVRLQAQLEEARLAQAKEQLLTQQTRLDAGEISKTDFSNIEISLAHAIEAAHNATTQRERAELDAAELNLRRQQKLRALGSAGKSDVARAEKKLAELKAQKN
jgi:hypothetical protein